MLDDQPRNLALLKKKALSPKFLLAIVVLIIILIRLIFLDADTVSIQAIHNEDEGNYSLNVRNYVVEGVWIKDQTNFFLISPVFSFLQLPFVKIFGVHFWSFRLINTVSGLLTILVGYLFLRNLINKKAAGIFCVLLGFNFLYLVHNRIAMPETTQGLFFLLAIVVYYYGDTRNNNWLIFLSGFVSTLTVLTKTSAIVIYPIIGVLILNNLLKNHLLQKSPDLINNLKKFSRIVFSYLSGVAVPSLIWFYLLIQPNMDLFNLAKFNLIDRNRPTLASLMNPDYWKDSLIPDFLKGGEANVWFYFPILIVLFVYFALRFLRRYLKNKESRLETLLFTVVIIGFLNFLIVWYKPARFFVIYLIPLSLVGAYIINRFKLKWQVLILSVYLIFNLFLITKYILIDLSFSLRNASNNLENAIGDKKVVGESLLHLDNSRSKTYNFYFLMVMYSPNFPMDQYLKDLAYPEYVLFNSPAHQEEEKKVQELGGYEKAALVETNLYFPETRKVNVYRKVNSP